MPEEQITHGDGWIATRTADGYRLSWLTNDRVVNFMSAEATAEITEADFELLRADPKAAYGLILKYEPVQEIK